MLSRLPGLNKVMFLDGDRDSVTWVVPRVRVASGLGRMIDFFYSEVDSLDRLA